MTPFVGFSNVTLRRLPRVKAGQYVTCPMCKRRHRLRPSVREDGLLTGVLLFYTCRGQPYLGAVNGRLIVGARADVSGALRD